MCAKRLILIGNISYMCARRLILGGCESYLDYIHDVSMESPSIDSVPVVH